MTLPIGLTNRKRGFTLLELSMVILVISIIVAIATPKFKATYQTIQFRNTVYNLVKIMNYARDRAIVEGKPFRVHFFEDEGSFCLETIPETEEDESESPILRRQSRSKRAKEEYEMVRGSIGQKLFFPKDISLDIDEPDEDYVIFYPDGNADECVIYIEGKGKQVYTVTTKSSVGFVKLYNEKKRL